MRTFFKKKIKKFSRTAYSSLNLTFEASFQPLLSVNKVPPVKFRIDQSASPVVMDQSEPSILPVENDLSKNGHSSPLITDESKPSKKRKLPNCDDTNDQKKSPKNSTPPPPVEPVQPVANHVQEPVKMVFSLLRSDFSSLFRKMRNKNRKKLHFLVKFDFAVRLEMTQTNRSMCLQHRNPMKLS